MKRSESHHFFAYLARMKLIDRWSLMRCTQRENVQEHSLQVAIIAHALCLIKNKYFEGKLSPDGVALRAIFHDATEVLTGDLPTPVKYFSPEIRSAYLMIEDHAVEQLLKLLPEEFKEDYRKLFLLSEEKQEIKLTIKAADTLAAYIKCQEEEAAGNHEFSRAKKSIETKLEEIRHRPEVDYFVKHFIPSFSLTLDELSTPLEI
ncbi:MAG: 5'-deoxynucleotidase [Bdellovibrio sp. CG10_big_fil_rev_8_21_14_0_10_47_8]|nr:MAG: 5'-deoxynucleotidase [Bdellovibrio sp. CG10_big_fil_rev_8_21_14_0_10_47_8]